MSRKQPPEEIVAAATTASPFAGVDISKIMSSTGPVVKCVLLCATSTSVATANVKGADADLSSKSIDDNDVEKSATASLHQDLITEINVDTTPRKSQVNSILGGPFTFLGQYEDEGIVVMIRRPPPDFADGDDGDSKDDDNLSINPHRLQPPFHNAVVLGDILLMRVAPVAEEVAEVVLNEDDDGAMTSTSKETPSLRINKNDDEEFFLDYTKDDYLKFAARTDIIALDDEEEEDDESDAVDSSSDDNVGNDEEADDEEGQEGDEIKCDSDDEEDFDPDDSDINDSDDADDEEYQVGMMNMILNHMLRKFREDNGRGPDSIELLEMRKALADKMGVANVTGPPLSQQSSSSDDSDDTDNDKMSSKEDNLKGKDTRKRKMKVVVAEEMNETIELMPHGKSSRCTSNEEEGQDVKDGEIPSSEDNDEVARGHHSDSNKRARTT
jgi:hypothetical protein